MVLCCTNVSKHFGVGGNRHTVLDGICLEFEAGQTCGLIGPSGSGKTTLISIFGCLLSPCSGSVKLMGDEIKYRSKSQLTSIRRNQIGFVFQQSQLLPFLSVYDNLFFAGSNAGLLKVDLKKRIDFLAGRLGIQHIQNKFPSQASGGERQRVAVARALLHRPKVLLADEPTAALDWENGKSVVELMVDMARTEQSLLITVTHDNRVASYFDRRLVMDSGKITQYES